MEAPPAKANILLVDDRADKLLALQSMLEDLNQNLISVRSGDEALRRLLQEDFAVILLDVNMPGMDGFETAAMIRQRRRSESTPIIFISAVNYADTHVSRGYSLGAVDYILTPVVPEILRAKIAVFVELFRKTEQIKRQAEEHAELVREQAARAEAEAAQQRLAFLAEASNVLAESLDYQQTFDNLARLVVPQLADFCIIDRLDDDGRLRQVTVAHRDPDQEPLLRQIRYPDPHEKGHGALRIFQTGKSEICEELTEEIINELFPGEDGDLIRRLNPKGYIAVPLIARGNAIGAITMANAAGTRLCGPKEHSLAEELAQRAALALDNAGLYLAADRARLDAVAANRAKDRFLAMLSHELRTPLTPVITSLINLESDGSVPAAMRQPLKVIRRNVELEARLIDDLLDLTRVGTGKINLNSEVVDVSSLLYNAIDICQPDINAKDLKLTVDSEVDTAYVHGDPARLQQIFWNLLKNAVKFTPTGGITVSLAVEAPDRLRIRVSDTGLGIDPDLLPRIFMPFEQGESGQHGGLGLGLSITKTLVDLHGGEIEADSVGPGEGATFTVFLPLTEAPAYPPAHPEPAAQGDDVGPIHILLVEDHVDSNDSLTMMLELHGYKVTSAYNVQTALALARENEYDVLISDLGLPDGNAGEVMSAVSELSSAVGIAISGYGMEEDIRRSRGYGFSHHLIKPVEVNRLEAVLGKISRSQKKARRSS
ncbi:hypothetical protein BH23VER1_BH23VER1_20280 [soil metagenome]